MPLVIKEAGPGADAAVESLASDSFEVSLEMVPRNRCETFVTFQGLTWYSGFRK